MCLSKSCAFGVNRDKDGMGCLFAYIERKPGCHVGG
jgi:hypothetical protein